jgi:hypothetical protein
MNELYRSESTKTGQTTIKNNHYIDYIKKCNIENMDLDDFVRRVIEKDDQTSDDFKNAMKNLNLDDYELYAVQQRIFIPVDRSAFAFKYRFLINTKEDYVQIIEEANGSFGQTSFRTYNNVSQFPLKSFLKFPVFIVKQEGYFITIEPSNVEKQPSYVNKKFTLHYPDSQNITIEEIFPNIMTKNEWMYLQKLHIPQKTANIDYNI